MELFGVELSAFHAVAGAVVLYVVVQLLQDRHVSTTPPLQLAHPMTRTSQLRAIPVVGYSFPILNWITGVQYIYNSHDLVQEGYEKVALHDLIATQRVLIISFSINPPVYSALPYTMGGS